MDWCKFIVHISILYAGFLCTGWCSKLTGKNANDEETPKVRWYTDDSRELLEHLTLMDIIAESNQGAANNIGFIADDIFTRYPFNRLEYEPTQDFYLLHGLRIKKEKLWALMVALLPIEYKCSCQCDTAYVSGQPFDLLQLVNLYVNRPKTPKQEIIFESLNRPLYGEGEDFRPSQVAPAVPLMPDVQYMEILPDYTQLNEADFDTPSQLQAYPVGLDYIMENKPNLLPAEEAIMPDYKVQEMPVVVQNPVAASGQVAAAASPTPIVQPSSTKPKPDQPTKAPSNKESMDVIDISIDVTQESKVKKDKPKKEIVYESPKVKAFYERTELQVLHKLVLNQEMKVYMLDNKPLTLEEIWKIVINQCSCKHDDRSKTVTIEGVVLTLEKIIKGFIETVAVPTIDSVPLMLPIIAQPLPVHPHQPGYGSVFDLIPLSDLQFNPTKKIYTMDEKTVTNQTIWKIISDSLPISECDDSAQVVVIDNVPIKMQMIVNMFMTNYEVLTVDIYGKKLVKAAFSPKAEIELIGALHALPLRGLKYNRVHRMYALWRDHRRKEYLADEIITLIQVETLAAYQTLQDVIHRNSITLSNQDLLDKYISIYQLHTSDIDAYITQIHNNKHYQFYDKDRYEIKQILNALPFNGIQLAGGKYVLPDRMCTKAELFNLVEIFIREQFAYLWDILYNNLDTVVVVGNTELKLDNIVKYFTERPGRVLTKYSKAIQDILMTIPLHGLTYDYAQQTYFLNGKQHSSDELFVIIQSVITESDSQLHIFKVNGTQMHFQEIVNLFLENIITVPVAPTATAVVAIVPAAVIVPVAPAKAAVVKPTPKAAATAKPTTTKTTVKSKATTKPSTKGKGKGGGNSVSIKATINQIQRMLPEGEQPLELKQPVLASPTVLQRTVPQQYEYPYPQYPPIYPRTLLNAIRPPGYPMPYSGAL